MEFFFYFDDPSVVFDNHQMTDGIFMSCGA